MPPTDSGATRTAAHFAKPDSAPGSDPGMLAPAAPLSFGDYDVVGDLGAGGMGRVYKAADRKLSRYVAIKVLLTPDAFEASRFRGEASITAKLEHPNITRIFEIETTADGHPYLVLEYAEGGSLDRELRGAPQEPRRAAEMARTLAEAIQYAHEQGVIHRDLKPANVLRAKDGTLKLTDFGLAKQYELSSGLTPSGAVMGTPSYMAPEQAAGAREVGPAADVYGLGAILYELLTGRPPFRGVNMVETLEQVRWADPAPPSRLAPRLPRDLGTICLKCLAKAPARRYATAADLAADLRRWMDGETIAARPAPAWERGWRQFRRRPWETAAVAAGVLLAVLLATGAVYAMRQEAEKGHEKELAAEKERAEQLRRDAESAAAARVKEWGDKSRRALDAIKQHLTTGELRSTRGLNDLHGVLADYYRQHIDEALTDPTPDRAALAELAYGVGEQAYQSGRYDTAGLLFGQAREGFAAVAGADPRHRPRLGDALVKVARVLFDRNRDDEAAAACAEAERLWTGIHAAAGDNRARDTAALQLAEVEHLRGELARRRYDIAAARDAFTRAIDHRRRVAGDYPALPVARLRAADPAERTWAVRCLRELGRGYGYRGDEYLSLGEVPDADRDYWDSHRVRQKVFDVLKDAGPAADPAEFELARFQLGRSWMNLASVQARHRAYATAKQNANEALAHREELVKSGPNHAEYLVDMAANLTEVGRLTLLERRGEGDDRRAALAALTRAAEQTVSEKGQPGFRTREVLADAHAVRAQLLADGSDPAARAAAAADARRVEAFLDEAQKLYPNVLRYHFHRVTMQALLADLDGLPPDNPRWQAVLDGLGRVLAGGFRDEHPDDVRTRPCFRRLAADPRFVRLFAAARP